MENNSIYGDNFEAERVQRETEKYGHKVIIPKMAAHAHVYTKHSVTMPYNNYDRPINESV